MLRIHISINNNKFVMENEYVLLTSNTPLIISGFSSLLKLELKDNYIDIDSARTRQEAMEKLSKNDYSLVIINLENFSAELSEKILNLQKSIPILIYSNGLSMSSSE